MTLWQLVTIQSEASPQSKTPVSTWRTLGLRWIKMNQEWPCPAHLLSNSGACLGKVHPPTIQTLHTKVSLWDNSVKVLEWTSQNPHLNPTKHPRKDLKSQTTDPLQLLVRMKARISSNAASPNPQSLGTFRLQQWMNTPITDVKFLFFITFGTGL